MRTVMSCSAMWIAIVITGGAAGQALPRATMQYGAFAFPDQSGTRLLAISEPPRSELFHTAFCSAGHRVSVRFDHRQVERDGHNGRQTRYNFDQLAGAVFTVVDPTIDATSTCFLASDALTSSATLLSAEASPETDECGPRVQRQLASVRSRGVVNCWAIAQLASGARLLLAEFDRQGNDALASVVFADGDRLIFADYARVFRGDGNDQWRVDTDDALAPGRFEIVFLLQRGTSYTLGVKWVGGEGSSLAGCVCF